MGLFACGWFGTGGLGFGLCKLIFGVFHDVG